MAANLFEQLVALAHQVARLPWTPAHGFYWPYLVSALAVAAAVYGVRRRRARGLLGYAFARSVWAHRSALLDYRFFLVNNSLVALAIAPLFLSTEAIRGAAIRCLEALFGPAGPALPAGPTARLGFTLLIVAAADLAFFASHWLFHRVAWLWEFHKVHHAAEVLTPVTAHRAHPVQLVATAGLTALLVGLVVGICDYAFARPLDALGWLGVNAVTFLFFLAGSNLQHSHVWLSFGPLLGRLFVSPAHHQLHHSVDPRHHGSNYGHIFAVWDWLAGTLLLPGRRERLCFGLPAGESAQWSSLWSLYARPFGNLARRLAASRG